MLAPAAGKAVNAAMSVTLPSSGPSLLGLPLVSDPARENAQCLCLMTPCTDPAQIRTILIGHSNAAPIARALITRRGAKETGAMQAAARAGLAALRGTEVNAAYRDAAKALGRLCNVALVWLGNQANGDFLLTIGRAIDLVPRGYPDTHTAPNSQIVPEEALRAHFAPSVATLDGMLAELGPGGGGRRRFVVGIQPPLFDNDLIRQRLSAEPHYAALAQQFGLDIAHVGITAAPVRRKLWFVLREMYRETAALRGAIFVDVPPGAFDAQGFLRAELAASDVTHPGLPYGRLMIEHLAQQIAAMTG
ncbi:MAG: hypothetical protein IT548_13320 [Alphaproteobacteria bacterium]|nr:hypothetical protein [Alphaproteobacteria bacterium]